MGFLGRMFVFASGVGFGLVLAVCVAVSVKPARAATEPEPVEEAGPRLEQSDASNAWVFHDDRRGVTCWRVYQGLSCLPDSQLAHPVAR